MVARYELLPVVALVYLLLWPGMAGAGLLPNMSGRPCLIHSIVSEIGRDPTVKSTPSSGGSKNGRFAATIPDGKSRLGQGISQSLSSFGPGKPRLVLFLFGPGLPDGIRD